MAHGAVGATMDAMARYRVLVAGGGVAALEGALALQHVGEDRVSVTLVAPEPRFWYRPLAVVESFGVGRLHGLDLAELADECGALFVVDALASVDADAHVARTTSGAEFPYDALLVATGARPVAAIPGAITFRGPADVEAFSAVLAALQTGSLRRVVFAVPGGVAWPLPLYELALQTAAFLDERGVSGVELTLVTHEDSPLGVFGTAATTAVAELLERRGIALRAGAYALAFEGSALALAPSGRIATDAVVALPRLTGVPIDGIPCDADGFIPTDPSGRVRGVDDVYAAGDAVAFPVKQGGIAAQQADAAAETIAAVAGASIEPEPFRPVLRGLLLTGGAPTFMRAELAGGSGDTSVAGGELLWWPPGKIVGRYLAPFLAERAGVILSPPPAGDVLPVEVVAG
jgi:sulfide:quinone oxidoreductase